MPNLRKLFRINTYRIVASVDSKRLAWTSIAQFFAFVGRPVTAWWARALLYVLGHSPVGIGRKTRATNGIGINSAWDAKNKNASKDAGVTGLKAQCYPKLIMSEELPIVKEKTKPDRDSGAALRLPRGRSWIFSSRAVSKEISASVCPLRRIASDLRVIRSAGLARSMLSVASHSGSGFRS